MAYMGGKSTVYEHITKVLNDKRYDGYDYIEPFCGYCHILRRIRNKRTYQASDANEMLVGLLKRVQSGDIKFPKISRKRYDELKLLKNNNKLKPNDMALAGLAAFCYSYNGKEFGGYTPKSGDSSRDYVKERLRYYKRLNVNETFKKSKIESKMFFKLLPKRKPLIYCDPPYANTTQYGKNEFDSVQFWEHVRKLVKKGHIVYISEYNAPTDFRVVSTHAKFSTMSGSGCSGERRVENLYQHKSQLIKTRKSDVK